MINHQLSYLKEVQRLEKQKGASQKVVAIEYAGLVGKFLSPKEKTFPGYEPVIPEETPQTAAAPPVNLSPTETAVSGSQPLSAGVVSPEMVAVQIINNRALIEEIVQKAVKEYLEKQQNQATETPAPTESPLPSPEPVEGPVPAAPTPDVGVPDLTSGVIESAAPAPSADASGSPAPAEPSTTPDVREPDLTSGVNVPAEPAPVVESAPLAPAENAPAPVVESAPAAPVVETPTE